MRTTSEWVRAALQLLAPQTCPGCDLETGGDPTALMCPACAPLLERPTSGRAPGSAAAAFLYGGPLADGLLRLKYAGRSELARPLGALLAHEAGAYAGLVDRVIPVALHPSRLRARGYNQSALIARPVARALGVPLDTSSLRRLRPTRDQAGLPRSERRANVCAAFACRRSRTPGTRVLLIDDVVTTGATLAAARSALRDAGFDEVRTLALARAVE